MKAPLNVRVGFLSRWIPNVVMLFACLGASALAFANQHALVAGVSQYPDKRLDASTTDALAVSRELTATGYRVNVLVDADKSTLRRALDTFSESARGSASVVVYFAGRVRGDGGRNYLLPAGVRGADARAVGIALQT